MTGRAITELTNRRAPAVAAPRRSRHRGRAGRGRPRGLRRVRRPARAAGPAIVRHRAAAGALRPVVEAGPGTNYIVTTAQLQQLARLIGPHRKLVLINTYAPDGWSEQVNATDAAFIRQHPDIVLGDWYDAIKNRLSLLWPAAQNVVAVRREIRPCHAPERGDQVAMSG